MFEDCEFDEDSMPCECSCGTWFDLNDGNSCGECNTIFCTECVEEPFDTCERCEYLNGDEI